MHFIVLFYCLCLAQSRQFQSTSRFKLVWQICAKSLVLYDLFSLWGTNTVTFRALWLQQASSSPTWLKLKATRSGEVAWEGTEQSNEKTTRLNMLNIRLPRGAVSFLHIDWYKLPREWAAVVLELKNRPSPKSPSFTTPVAVMNTFAGFISKKK